MPEGNLVNTGNLKFLNMGIPLEETIIKDKLKTLISEYQLATSSQQDALNKINILKSKQKKALKKSKKAKKIQKAKKAKKSKTLKAKIIKPTLCKEGDKECLKKLKDLKKVDKENESVVIKETMRLKSYDDNNEDDEGVKEDDSNVADSDQR